MHLRTCYISHYVVDSLSQYIQQQQRCLHHLPTDSWRTMTTGRTSTGGGLLRQSGHCGRPGQSGPPPHYLLCCWCVWGRRGLPDGLSPSVMGPVVRSVPVLLLHCHGYAHAPRERHPAVLCAAASTGNPGGVRRLSPCISEYCARCSCSSSLVAQFANSVHAHALRRNAPHYSLCCWPVEALAVCVCPASICQCARLSPFFSLLMAPPSFRH